MSKDMIGFDYHGPDATCMPEVDIRSVAKIRIVGCDCYSLTNPHMPVLLTAIVTSPGLSMFPFWRDSRLGSAEATQRSCLGFV